MVIRDCFFGDQAIQLSYAGNDAEYIQFTLTGGFKEAGDNLKDVLETLIKVNIKVVEKTAENADVVYMSSRTITLVVIWLHFF